MKPLLAAVPAGFLVALLLLAPCARADDTIKHPGEHPAYSAEIEPHVLLGWYGAYGETSYGVGARVSIPIVDNGFVSEINDSVAISFGMDVMRYQGCWYHGDCAATYFFIPALMQWNFYVAKEWSVFGEPGLLYFHGFISDCPPGDSCPPGPNTSGIEPAIYLGARYHFNERMALTMRLGFPNISVGLSFFP